MKQHIDTAPVWAAYEHGGECPLCTLERRSERDYITYFLGGSVMEPAQRIEVNRKGFCAQHFRLLYDAGNRLGLALMAHSYLKETITRLEKGEPEAPRRSWLGGRAQTEGDRAKPPDGCALCDRLGEAMARYEETLLYMWSHETAFREAFGASKGLCVRHCAHLLARAPQSMSSRDARAFCEAAGRVTLDNLKRVEGDLDWFTRKFDFRNQDKPWGESRDAVERALNKLRSNTIRDPEEEDAP